MPYCCYCFAILSSTEEFLQHYDITCDAMDPKYNVLVFSALNLYTLNENSKPNNGAN
jgi:hypothetical protein